MAAGLDDRPGVLIVDDRPENLMALEAVLEPLQLELVRATSGEDALRALLDRDFAAVILDVQMPGMDGFETASFIRRRPRSRLTPILFLSAVSTDMSHVMRGYESGAVDYVLKPFDPAILRSKVQVFADLELERRARARSEHLLLSAMGASPNGLAIVDEAGVIVHANPAFGGLVGRGGAPLEGRELGPLLRTDAPAITTGLGRVYAGDDNRFDEETALGTGVPVRLVASAVPGDQRHVIVELWDLRARIEREEARLALVEERSARAEAEALYAREHDIATTLQRGLLPSELPPTPGVQLASFLEAGGEGTQVGGDWFDAFPLPGGHVGLIVGDVSGRGVAAASRMGELRTVARAFAQEGHSAVEVVERLNAYHHALAPDALTTLIYAIVEPDLGRARIVNAGHPSPGIAVPGTSPRVVDGHCPALGLVEVCRPSEAVVDFPPGATLVLYTDGLVERRSEGTHEGTARLLSALAQPGADVEETCAAVLAACGMADGDDVTILCARATPVLGDDITLNLLPTPECLAAARRLVRRWLAEADVEDEAVPAMTLSINEAWQNAIEHAHEFAARPVTVRLLRDHRGIEFTVRDAGRADLPVGDPDRGRGLDIMRAHADRVDLELGSPAGGSVVLRWDRPAQVVRV